MNRLVVGTDKTSFQSVSGNFLFIDDGPLIDKLELDAVFPEGADTLTKKNSNFVCSKLY